MAIRKAIWVTASCSVLTLVFSQHAQNFAALCLSLSLAFLSLSLLLKKRASIICTVLAATCIGVFLAEALLSLLPSPAIVRTYHDPHSDYATQYFSQTDLGSQGRKGVHSSKKLASNGTVIYDAVYSIGEDGFRITPSRNSGYAFRINLFGCSVAFGEGLNDHETIPFYLAQKISNSYVKNFGFHGYGVHQALAILESQRDTKGQINLLITAPWHALRSACVPSYTVGSPQFILNRDGGVRRIGTCGSHRHPETMLSNSRLYTLLQTAIEDSAQDDQLILYLALIEAMAKLSKERGQAFIIGFIRADNKWFTGTYSNDSILSRLREIADDVVDVTLADSAEHISPKYYIHDLDKHPSALANRERSQLLISVLAKYLASS